MPEDTDKVHRGLSAQKFVQQGEVSRARQCLVGAKLAPGNQETLTQLQSKRPRESMRDIPAAALEFLPEHALVLDRDKL